MSRKNASRTKQRNYRRKMRQYNSRSRLFSGNVRSPGEFIFIWALIFVYIVGTAIFCISFGYHSKDSYECKNETFKSCYRKNDVIVVVTNGGEYSAWASLCDLDGISALEAGDLLEMTTAKSDLLALSTNGKELLKLSDSEQYMRESLKTPLIIFSIFILLWAVFVAVSVWVMCNAHKLPRKLVTAFVKESYLYEPPVKK